MRELEQVWDERIQNKRLKAERDDLQRKLDIAVEALEHLSICGGPNCDHNPFRYADEALKKLKGE